LFSQVSLALDLIGLLVTASEETVISISISFKAMSRPFCLSIESSSMSIIGLSDNFFLIMIGGDRTIAKIARRKILLLNRVKTFVAAFLIPKIRLLE